MTNITMVVELMVIVKTENDFSLTVEDAFPVDLRSCTTITGPSKSFGFLSIV